MSLSLFPGHVLDLSECLNAVLGVLVVGSERRDDKNKEIYANDVLKALYANCKTCHIAQVKCQLNYALIIHFMNGFS